MIRKLKINLTSLLMILIGSLSWSLTMVKSGLIYPFGMGFWGPNGHDGVWHIALSESLSRGSWQMPVFSGETIKNYHIGFDLVLAALYKITLIPISVLYFQIIPVLIALFIGYFVYRFVYEWKKSNIIAFWTLFFLYFGGSLGWVVTLLKSGQISGESLFWSQQAISTLVNPPFALSLLVLFAGLFYLMRGFKTNNKKMLTFSTFLFGVLIQIKVYAGLLILAGLFLAGIWMIFSRKGIQLLRIFGGSVIITILLFTPLERGGGSSVIFKQFWFLETLFATKDRLYWLKMAQAMQNYKLSGNIIKLSLAYVLALFIFIVGNFGSRILFVKYIYKKLKNITRINYIELILLTIIVLGILIPLLFVQSGTAWNTIQFMYYSLVFSAILAGVAVGKWMEDQVDQHKMLNNVKLLALSLIILLITIPTSVGTLWFNYLPTRPPAKLTKSEIDALNYLANQPDGVVLTQPFNKVNADEAIYNPPRPLYLYESTAYVSAYSGKPAFLEDVVNLEITGYDWITRRGKVEHVFETNNTGSVDDFMKDNNIKYVYVINSSSLPQIALSTNMEKIYENDQVTIFKIRQ